PYLERRPVNVVRELEPQAEARGAERHPEVGADAEVERELRLEAELVDRDQQRPAAVGRNRDIRRGGRPRLDEHLQRWRDSLLDVIGDAADAEERVRPHPRVPVVVEEPDGAADVVIKGIDVDRAPRRAVQRRDGATTPPDGEALAREAAVRPKPV